MFELIIMALVLVLAYTGREFFVRRGWDFDSALAFLSKKLRTLQGRGLKLVLVLALGVGLVIFISGGILRVNEGEQALVFRLGRHVATYSGGWYPKIPFLDDVTMVNTQLIRRFEYGFRTDGRADRETLAKESKMLTRDGKLLNIFFVTQYNITNPLAYVINMPESDAARERMIRSICEASFREVVASTLLDDALTTGKEEIQIRSRDLINERLDLLRSGVTVRQIQIQDVDPPDRVKAAFNEVNTAKAEKDRDIMKAREYANKHVTDAEGEYRKIINEAESYAARRTSVVGGELERVKKLSDAYGKNPELVKLSLYIEAAQEFWPKAKIIITEGENSVNVLSLENMLKNLEKKK